MTIKKWVEPADLNEAVTVLNNNVNAIIYAGGTDILPLMNYGLKSPEICVSLRKCKLLTEIEVEENGIRIGSMVNLVALTEDKFLKKTFSALVSAAIRVASPQIRNIATVGGNILQERRCKYYNRSERWRDKIDSCFLMGGDRCYQVPKSDRCCALYYSDLATPLMAYQAVLEIWGKEGLRKVEIGKVFSGDGTRNINKKDILTGIFLPLPQSKTRAVFIKESIRFSLDFPVVNLAVVNSPNIKKIGIVVGAMAPYPLRLSDTEGSFSRLINVNTVDIVETLTEMAYEELKKKRLLVSEVDINTNQKMQRFKGAFKSALEQVLLNSRNMKGDNQYD